MGFFAVNKIKLERVHPDFRVTVYDDVMIAYAQDSHKEYRPEVKMFHSLEQALTYIQTVMMQMEM